MSVSELVRRAIRESYGKERLSWDEVFSIKLQPGSVKEDGWVYDPMFDDDYIGEALAELEDRSKPNQ